MCDKRHAYDHDDRATATTEIRECAFEIIGVKNWLGRYTLIAGVYTQAEDQPPDFLLLEYVLDPTDYELEDMPLPPGGESIAQNRQSFAPASAS